tara:strand:- start:1012 stop:1932 length:921 start_codon:yes stop_codon:yes gene_type:complete
MSKLLIVIVGPTAIGKTALAIKLAKHYKTEIISADSRQFYKELNIGTAKPSNKQLQSIRHHLIDNISICDNYNISQFESDAKENIDNLFKTKDYAIVVGGSGLYINTILYGIDKMPKVDDSLREKLNSEYLNNGLRNLHDKLKKLDPISYEKIDLDNHRRVIRALEVTISSKKPYSSFLKDSDRKPGYNEIIIGLNTDRTRLHSMINKRVEEMIECGLVEEVKKLRKFKHLNSLNTIGYKEIFDYLEDKMNLEQAIENIKTNTRRYAKRQITWFKSNKMINWFDYEYKIENIINQIDKHPSIQQST